MPKVNFENLSKVVDAQPGESILDVALRHEIPLAHACGGFCACTTCHVLVKAGADQLSPMEDEEEERLDRAVGIKLNSRLGCQAKVKGDVTVEIVNVEHGH